MIRKIRYCVFILFLLSSFVVKAQPRLPSLDEVDMLLTNITVQLEITSGIDAMYNYDFKVAESQFTWMQRHYPEHPLPYFLKGLCEWWKILPNVDGITQYDKSFHAYMDSAIHYAKVMHKADPTNVEADFFLAGSWAFKARLLGERHLWSRATVASKKALNYFEQCKGEAGEELGMELYFGDGLYNYYVEWIKENYKVLRPVLWFFGDGDKEKGLKQLETASSQAFYTRIEAMYYLMKIHSSGGGNMKRAYQVSKYLRLKYPNNPYFHRFYARTLYLMGKHELMKQESLSLLKKVEEGRFGYEDISGRYSSYYLGVYYANYLVNPDSAVYYFKKTVAFAERSKAYQSGYYLHALSKLGRIHKNNNDYVEAKVYYDRLMKHSHRKSSLYKEAKKFNKEFKKWKKNNPQGELADKKDASS